MISIKRVCRVKVKHGKRVNPVVSILTRSCPFSADSIIHFLSFQQRVLLDIQRESSFRFGIRCRDSIAVAVIINNFFYFGIINFSFSLLLIMNVMLCYSMGRSKISLYLNTFFYNRKRKMNVSGKQNVSEWLFLEFLYLWNNFLSVIDLVILNALCTYI